MPRERRFVDLSEVLSERSGQAEAIQIRPGVFKRPKGPGTSAALTRQIFPPWVYKLPVSRDFNQNNFTTLLPAVTSLELVSFQLPGTYVGYIQIFGIFVLSPTAATDITFILRINQGPVEGWDNIREPPGVANFFVQNFSELQVRAPAGARISVLGVNAGAAAFTVGAKIAGWYHPESEEQRIYGKL